LGRPEGDRCDVAVEKMARIGGGIVEGDRNAVRFERVLVYQQERPLAVGPMQGISGDEFLTRLIGNIAGRRVDQAPAVIPG